MGRMLRHRYLRWRTSVAINRSSLFSILIIPITMVNYEAHAHVRQVPASAYNPRAIGFLILSLAVGIVDNLIRTYLIASGADDLRPVVSLIAIIDALIFSACQDCFKDW